MTDDDTKRDAGSVREPKCIAELKRIAATLPLRQARPILLQCSRIRSELVDPADELRAELHVLASIAGDDAAVDELDVGQARERVRTLRDRALRAIAPHGGDLDDADTLVSAPIPERR